MATGAGHLTSSQEPEGRESMSIRDEPHYEVPSADLASWIERQGDRWWNIDGDRILTGRLSFPCPGDELAGELRRLNRSLLVQDRRPQPEGKGEVIGADRLDELATTLGDSIHIVRDGVKPTWAQDRLFFLSWKGRDDEWMLVEDSQTTESNRADVASMEGKR
jgi:hypothetical protein